MTERKIVAAMLGGPKAMPELLESMSSKGLSGAIKKAIARLDELDLLALTIPEKPRSKNQRRKFTPKGERVGKQLNIR